MFLIQKPILSFLPHKPFFPSWAYELTLLSLLLFKEAIYHFLQGAKKWSLSGISELCYLPTMPVWKWRSFKAEKMNMTDLPELTIERILEKLSPSDLCKMSAVCSHLREICTSDHLWKRHMKEKWSRVVGEEAWKKWELQVASRRELEQVSSKDSLWCYSWLKRKMKDGRKQRRSVLAVGSLISFYQVLESGRFSFPAQVYNRENGNAGFLLSCYDAEICYKPRTNMFYARYPPNGKKVPAIEEVPWERVRAHVGTFAHDLHVSDCLSELRPGDHIEIQWRRSKELPYGWWYGVVGHLEACEGRLNGCKCLSSDTIVLEFNHHPPGSRWRKKIINRKEHREEENEEGFNGGIRKVQNKEEISVWKQFCTAEVQH